MSQKSSATPSFSDALQSHETKASPANQAQRPSQNASSSKVQQSGHSSPKQNKAEKTDQGDTEQKTQNASQDENAEVQTVPHAPAPASQAGKDGKILLDSKDAETDATEEASLTADQDPAILAAMNAANMAAQPANDAGRKVPALTEGVAEQQDEISDLLQNKGTNDSTGAEKLFQLGSAEESGNAETALRTDKDGHFGSLLNQTLDKQGAASLQGNSQAAAVTANPASANAAPARQFVSTPVATQGWSEEVAQKVSWTAQNGNGRAELILTPAHMGRIEVSIHVHGDQATATFIAANANAREALQDAMPQLREVLSNAGIQLGQANVSANSNGQNWSGMSDQSGFQTGSYATTGSNPADAGLDSLGMHSAPAWSSGGNGLVDIFA